jgi:hypothetical protein
MASKKVAVRGLTVERIPNPGHPSRLLRSGERRGENTIQRGQREAAAVHYGKVGSKARLFSGPLHGRRIPSYPPAYSLEGGLVMKQPRLASIVLTATLLAGCATHYQADRQPGRDDRVGAVAVNIWHVPGRALICGASALLAGAALTLTLGQVYEDASQIMHGGCAGPWTVEAEGIREAVADR